jgi:hypothetical protein
MSSVTVCTQKSDVLELIYSDPTFDISQLKIESPEQYLTALKELGIDLPVLTVPVNAQNLSKSLIGEISLIGTCPRNIMI